MRVVVAIVASLLASCSGIAPPTADEQAQIDKPSPKLQQQLDVFAPLAINWLNRVASEMRPGARELSTQERLLASEVGVMSPASVRIALVEEMPLPHDEPLRSMALKLGYGNKAIAGGCIGSLVWINRRHADNRALLAHELVHVAQQERMSQEQYFRRYMAELAVVGYARSPLEAEANAVMSRYRDTP